jgi:hypothetical protein
LSKEAANDQITRQTLGAQFSGFPGRPNRRLRAGAGFEPVFSVCSLLGPSHFLNGMCSKFHSPLLLLAVAIFVFTYALAA